jgi:hypothetical protein
MVLVCNCISPWTRSVLVATRGVLRILPTVRFVPIFTTFERITGPAKVAVDWTSRVLKKAPPYCA